MIFTAIRLGMISRSQEQTGRRLQRNRRSLKEWVLFNDDQLLGVKITPLPGVFHTRTLGAFARAGSNLVCLLSGKIFTRQLATAEASRKTPERRNGFRFAVVLLVVSSLQL